MTIAACFRFSDGIPYLIGDALLSTSTNRSSINIPTSSNLVFEREYEGVLLPFGLKQKIIVLSDHLALGWSDNWAQSAALIREVSEEFHDSEVPGTEVTKFLDSKKEEYPDVNLVGISKFEDIFYVMYFNGALRCAHSQLKDFFAIGTGASYLSALVKQNTFPTSGDHREYVCSISGLIGGMLGQEMVDRSTLLNNFGGAFELIHYYSDNKFKKFDKITYFFWSANQYSDGKIYVFGLPIIITYKSNGICSLVSRFTGNPSECSNDGLIPNFEVEHFRLNPVFGLTTEAQWTPLENPDFSSAFQCHYIFGKMRDESVFAQCLTMFGSKNCEVVLDCQNLMISNSEFTASAITEEILKFYHGSG